MTAKLSEEEKQQVGQILDTQNKLFIVATISKIDINVYLHAMLTTTLNILAVGHGFTPDNHKELMESLFDTLQNDFSEINNRLAELKKHLPRS